MDKGWWEGAPRSPLEIHALIHSEVSEATECVRIHEQHFHQGPNGKPEGEAVELVDAVIRIMDYFGRKKWNLAGILLAKMAYNAKRPHRHGGKRF